jgi:uncharacterized protein
VTGLRTAALVVLLIAACGEKGRAKLVDPDAPVRVVIATPTGDATVTVEVADTKPVIQKGLMHRESLAADRGMLFFMGVERDWGFYMKNTLIPLDIIFITKDLKVAGVARDTVPHSEESRKVGALSIYVLEVNAGWARAHGVERGARVRFENIEL